MDKYLTHSAEEYRSAVKVMKFLQSIPFDSQRSRAAQERERALLAAALEAARYAALRMDNPPLTWEHLKRMHGRAVYLDHPELFTGAAGIVDGRDETMVFLGPEGTERWAWSSGFQSKYYRFPVDGADLRFFK